MKIFEDLSNTKNMVSKVKKLLKQWYGPHATAKGRKEAISAELSADIADLDG
jgi:hypothetical protein